MFELLQNADDNDFTNAAQSLERPRVSFEIFDTEIVMECNEDGFNMENFAAICDVGKSSKLGAQGYIGEKGIGFKSVFMAAYKVQIQSGQLSFSFNHRQNDSGMGMISPVWEDPDPELSNQVTRVTLFLHDGGSAADVRQRHGQIVQQFREIEGTHLLFLRKVRNIRIKFSHDEKQNEEIEFHIAHTKKSSRATLTKKVDDGVPEHTQYQVFKHTAHHLPRSEDRAYLDLEKNGSTTAPAEIILAFPVDDEGLPIIKTHQVHAFLPIRDMGFKVS